MGEPEVLLTVPIIKYIDRALEDNSLSKNVREELELFSKKFPVVQSIPFRLVRTVYHCLNNDVCPGGKKVHLHEMIEGSDLVLPKTEVPPRNPELEARVQKLTAELQNKHYREITKDVDFMRAMNIQMWTVFNFIVTVGGSFAFGYKATQYALEGQGDTFPAQLITGLVLATLVFFADLYFLVRYDITSR
ncbi:hypothetical protein ScPMuIL_005258 [Solemya velum]